MAEDSEALIRRLQDAASAVLDPLVPRGGDVALLDFPNHSNVGDSMIWLGEVEYLKRRGARVVYVCDCDSYSAGDLARVIRPETTILLHGGGNFGSMWPRHHTFRLKVLRDFPEHPIVQLPQSIHFDAEAEIERTAAAIGRHERYVLLVRDDVALKLAQARFPCKSLACTDAAFFIGPLACAGRPQVDVIALLRTDIEKAVAAEESIGTGGPHARMHIVDWLMRPVQDKIRGRLVRGFGKVASRLGSRQFANLWPLWNAAARSNLARGRRLLCKGKIVVTDRLHAHILCLLLGKKHVMLDNSYGKLSSFHDKWTQDSGITVVAGSWPAAMSQLGRLIDT